MLEIRIVDQCSKILYLSTENPTQIIFYQSMIVESNRCRNSFLDETSKLPEMATIL